MQVEQQFPWLLLTDYTRSQRLCPKTPSVPCRVHGPINSGGSWPVHLTTRAMERRDISASVIRARNIRGTSRQVYPALSRRPRIAMEIDILPAIITSPGGKLPGLPLDQIDWIDPASYVHRPVYTFNPSYLNCSSDMSTAALSTLEQICNKKNVFQGKVV